MLHVLEIEAAVGVGAFLLAYGSFSLALWWLSRSSERRIRDRAVKTDTASTPNGESRSAQS